MSTHYTPLYNHQDNYGQWGHFDSPTLNSTGLSEDPLFTKTMSRWEEQGEPGTASNMMEMNRLDSDITRVSQDVVNLDLTVHGHIKQTQDAQVRLTQLEAQIQDIRSLVASQTAVITDLRDTITKQDAKILLLRPSPSSSPLKKKQKFTPSASAPPFVTQLAKPVTYASIVKPPPSKDRIIMPALCL